MLLRAIKSASPGRPKMPAVTDVTRFTPIVIPQNFEKRLKNKMRKNPPIHFSITQKASLIGLIKNMPDKTSNIAPTEYATTYSIIFISSKK